MNVQKEYLSRFFKNFIPLASQFRAKLLSNFEKEQNPNTWHNQLYLLLFLLCKQLWKFESDFSKSNFPKEHLVVLERSFIK